MNTLEVLGSLPEQMSVYLDRGYDSQTTRRKLKSRSLKWSWLALLGNHGLQATNVGW
jgi:IS5 family transposase